MGTTVFLLNEKDAAFSLLARSEQTDLLCNLNGECGDSEGPGVSARSIGPIGEREREEGKREKSERESE